MSEKQMLKYWLIKVYWQWWASTVMVLSNTLLFILVRYWRAVDVVALQAAGHSFSTVRIRVVTNFKKFAGRYLWWSQSYVTFQATHLDKSGLHYAYFPRNLRTVLEHFRTVVSTIWPYHFWYASPRHHTILAVFVFLHFWVGVYLSLHLCVKGKLTFRLHWTLDIPEAYIQKPSQNLSWSFSQK